jgi:hypothetical protein
MACKVELIYFQRALEGIITLNLHKVKAFKLPNSTVYEESCTKFSMQYSESLLIEYCSQSEMLSELPKTSATNPNIAIKYNTEKTRLLWLEGHMCFVFKVSS